MAAKTPLKLEAGQITSFQAGDTIASGFLPASGSLSLVQASDLTLSANSGMVVPDYYEIGSGFFLELAAGAVMEIT